MFVVGSGTESKEFFFCFVIFIDSFIHVCILRSGVWLTISVKVVQH